MMKNSITVKLMIVRRISLELSGEIQLQKHLNDKKILESLMKTNKYVI